MFLCACVCVYACVSVNCVYACASVKFNLHPRNGQFIKARNTNFRGG